jgi:hypothetical protein
MDELKITEYEYHKFVFSPVHNIGMKYGKCEVVTIERLLLDHNTNKKNRTNLRKLAHQIADIQEAKA